GMLFGSNEKWWADWGNRYAPHEGIDIVFYRKSNKTFDCDICSFDSNIKIPTMADGIILNICDDFLGQSVIIKHSMHNFEQSACKKSSVVVSYSHIMADKCLKAGMAVTKEQILGTVADTSMKKSGILPHLHISIMEISTTIPHNELNWNLFSNQSCDSVIFFNPLWF
ncbi:MAG: peptidoglycan DD-metalloendopeptidase family protein, partial [Desulfamplus sp.]|nr:peptidoglycan DD-metalloendopeptidase family protein [Desulfamplus sp.]